MASTPEDPRAAEGEPKSARSGGLSRWPRYEQATLGFREHWYPAARSFDLKRDPRGVKLLGEELVLVRDGGRVYTLEDRCAHRGIPLSAGRREFPCTVSCAYHGWTYSLESGELVAALTDGPDSAIVGRVRLRTYPAIERQGMVWVYIGDRPAPPIDDELPPDLLQSTYTGVRVRDFLGNWRIAMEGAVDPSHAFYLHRTALLSRTFDLPASRGRHWPEVEDGRYFTYRTEPPTPEAQYPGLGLWPRKRWWQRFRTLKGLSVRAFLPCASRVSGLVFTEPFVVFSWYVPIDASHYRWFQVLATQATGLRRLWAVAKYHLWLKLMYQREFLDQDATMNELAHPFYADGSGWSKERLFRPDSVIVAWRRFADERARGVQEAHGTVPAAQEAP